MFKQLKDETANSREMITSFLGYNHNLIQNAGEFWNTENISLRNYPVLSPRKLATDYRLVDLENDFSVDNVIKENDFASAFNCEPVVEQKGEGYAPISFANGVEYKGNFAQIIKFTNGKYSNKNGKNFYSVTSAFKGCSLGGRSLSLHSDTLCALQTRCGVNDDDREFYVLKKRVKTTDTRWDNQKTYYKNETDGESVTREDFYPYNKYPDNAENPSSLNLYEATNEDAIMPVTLLSSFSNHYKANNNIVTSIKINKIHFDKGLKKTEDKSRARGKKYYGRQGTIYAADWSKLSVDSSFEDYYYEEYDNDGDNVTATALVDINLIFRLNNQNKVCKLRNKKTGEEQIVYRGSLVRKTIQKSVSIDFKYRPQNELFGNKINGTNTDIMNVIVAFDSEHCTEYQTDFVTGLEDPFNHADYFYSSDDAQKVIENCKSDIENAFTEEFFKAIDKERVVEQLEEKALEAVTNDDKKITQYFDYVEYVNPNQEPKGTSIILKNGGIAWSNGKYIGYDGVAYSINKGTKAKTPVQLLAMDTKILEFPNNVFLDTADLAKGVQSLSVEETLENAKDGSVPYAQLCDDTGELLSGVFVGKTAPTNTDEKYGYRYWVDTSGKEIAFKAYSDAQDLWVNYGTAYCRIFGVNIENLKKGDTIKLSLEGKRIDGFDNDYYYIYDLMSDENYKGSIIISQIIESKKELSTDVVISREIPEMDYVTVAGNRIWGCKYGKNSEGKQVNQIYASALGDPTNWFTFQNTSQDSYYLTLGDDSEFTGATSVGGYPYFFKENGIYEIYGSYPAAYQLIAYEQQGCELGSEKSIAVVDGDIFFKSPVGVCVFSNGIVTQISKPLGTEEYHSAVGGGTCGEYYISMLDSQNQASTFVYNTTYGLWIKLNTKMYKQFCTNKSGVVMGITEENEINSFGRELKKTDGAVLLGREENIEWTAETGPIDYSYPDRKYISNIIIRAIIEADAVLDVYIQYDSNGIWCHCGTLRGNGTPQSSKLTITPQRCDHYAYKFIGSSGASVISIANEIEQTEG